MNEYISEKEQIEMIKDWWRENGRFTIISILIVIIVSMSWRYWQSSKNQKAEQASLIYENILSNESNQEFTTVQSQVNGLMSNFPRTPYASLGALISAQNSVNSNHLDDALGKLSWVIQHEKSKDIKQLAKLRKARVLLALKKYDEAFDTLKVVEAESYLPLINEVRGDIFLSRGDKSAAKIAYRQALNSLGLKAPNRDYLQMKYNQIDD